MTAPSFEDGAVLVDDVGRIAAVGSNDQVPAPRGIQSLEFPDAELMPGLVNCHTHLELTHLGGQNEEPEFARWIRRVRELKEKTPHPQFLESAATGLRECWRAGITCIADTGSTGAVMQALHDLGGRGIVYQEVFGPDPAQCSASMQDLDNAVLHLRHRATSQVLLGISPHAPYTVSAPLYEAVADYARREGLPVAVHLAESNEETQFVRDGVGPFTEALRARGIPVEAQHVSPVQYVVQRGVIAQGTLCIHCVQVDQDDVRTLAARGATIAHCPRSNAAHRHGRALVKVFQEEGIPVGLGTDSVVSVGELNLWAEAEAAGLRGDAALQGLTIEGARALGWDKEIGSLEAGKAADLAVFPSAALRGPSQPSPAALLTVVSGRIVHHISGQ